jgi:uncharacterized protein YjeT (DUF2065 family)
MGIIAIAFRAPLIFAPDASMKYFSKTLTSTKTRTRLFGLFILGLGVAMTAAAWGSSLIIGKVILIWGEVVIFFSILFMLIFPNIYRQLVEYFLDVDSSVLRFIGFIGVAVGAVFLYLGFIVLRMP